jgi:hypothetical protein
MAYSLLPKWSPLEAVLMIPIFLTWSTSEEVNRPPSDFRAYMVDLNGDVFDNDLFCGHFHPAPLQ